MGNTRQATVAGPTPGRQVGALAVARAGWLVAGRGTNMFWAMSLKVSSHHSRLSYPSRAVISGWYLIFRNGIGVVKQ